MSLYGNPPIIGGVVLHRVIGTGGMGVVYSGTHLRLRVPVAVKFMFHEQENAYNISRFIDEASLSAKVNSPFVVRVYDVNKEGPFQYIVQEFIDGETADRRVRDALALGKTLSEEFILNLAADAARGLAAIHAAGFLHLDIKPVNLMLSKGDGSAKILDLGLAQPFKASIRPGTIPREGDTPVDGGTPGYSSPEQLQFLHVGPSSDIYSLGVTLFELICGRRAYDVKTWEEAQIQQLDRELTNVRFLRTDVSQATADLIARCVRIDPSRRFSSAIELLAAIADVSQARLARNAPPVVSAFAKPLNVPPSNRYGPRVYCIDDNLEILALMADILTDSGCQVETFSSPKAGIQRMLMRPPDLLFLDMEMPEMNGLQCCRAIKTQLPLKDLPIVFLTGQTNINQLQMALREGATDYLIKPVHPAEVIARVQCLTRISRAQQELARLETEYKTFQQRLAVLAGKE